MKKAYRYDGEPPYICVDEDGYLSTPDGRLWNCHINDPARIRRARFHKWIDKHPLLTLVMGGLPIVIMIGGLVVGIAQETARPETDRLDPVTRSKVEQIDRRMDHLQALRDELDPPEPPDYDDPYTDHP